MFSATNINTIVTIVGMILTVYFALKGTKKKEQRRKSHRKEKKLVKNINKGQRKRCINGIQRKPIKQNVTKSQKCKGIKISLKINLCAKERWICIKLCIEPTER